MRAVHFLVFGLGILGMGTASAESCPDPSVVEPTTEYDAGRVWIHPKGWFSPLTDAPVGKLSEQGYRPSDAMIYVQMDAETRAYPVTAMAYHHVANDIVEGEPVVVTY